MFRLIELTEEPYRLPDQSLRSYSEDVPLVLPDLIAIADGASGIADRRILATCDSDARWIAYNFIEGLKVANEERRKNGIDDIKILLKTAIDIVIDRYKKDVKFPANEIKKYELPTTALILAMQHLSNPDKVTFVSISGGPAFYRNRLVPGSKTLRGMDRHFENMVREKQKQGKSYKWGDDEVLKLIRTERILRNTEDGYAVVDLGYDWLNHHDTTIIEAEIKKGDRIFMCSDGLSRLYETYKVQSMHQFVTDALNIGPTRMLEKLRDIELADWERTKFPRLKETDDVCAMLVEVE